MNIIKEMLNLPDTPSGKKKLNKLITKLGLGKKQKGDILKNVVSGDIGYEKQIFDYIYFRDFYGRNGELISPMFGILTQTLQSISGIEDFAHIYKKHLVHFRANVDAKFEKIAASTDTHLLFDENYSANRIASIPYYIGIPKYIFRTPMDKIDVLETLKIHDNELYNMIIHFKVDEKDIYNNFKMHYYTIQNYIDFANELNSVTPGAAITLSDLMNPAFVCYRLLHGYDVYHYDDIFTIDQIIDFSIRKISLIAYTDINIPNIPFEDVREIYFGSPFESLSKYIQFYNKNGATDSAELLEKILNIFKKYFVELSEEEYFRILTDNCKS